jgi:hypothetical protein
MWRKVTPDIPADSATAVVFKNARMRHPAPANPLLRAGNSYKTAGDRSFGGAVLQNPSLIGGVQRRKTDCAKRCAVQRVSLAPTALARDMLDRSGHAFSLLICWLATQRPAPFGPTDTFCD